MHKLLLSLLTATTLAACSVPPALAASPMLSAAYEAAGTDPRCLAQQTLVDWATCVNDLRRPMFAPAHQALFEQYANFRLDLARMLDAGTVDPETARRVDQEWSDWLHQAIEAEDAAAVQAQVEK